VDNSETRLAALDDHVSEVWPQHHRVVLKWSEGPIEDRLPGFYVVRVSPAKAGESWVYVSIGASICVEHGGLEYFIMSPVKDDSQVETLTMVAHYQSFEAHSLEVGSVVDIGRPWSAGSRFDHLVVTLPYPFGPKLENAVQAGMARFVWLVPISKSEASYIREFGFEKFEEKLESSGVDVIDPRRAMVA
jgi:hypothetical protein